MWNLNLPKKNMAITAKPATPTQEEHKKPPLDLGKPSPRILGRKSCKPPAMTFDENPIVLDHRGNRSRSVDSGPNPSTSKSYQQDLINEKKKSVPQISKKEENDDDKNEEKNQELELSSSGSSQNKEDHKNNEQQLEKQEMEKHEEEFPLGKKMMIQVEDEKHEEEFPFGKKMMIQVEDEKEELFKNDEIFQQDIKNLGTQ